MCVEFNVYITEMPSFVVDGVKMEDIPSHIKKQAFQAKCIEFAKSALKPGSIEISLTYLENMVMFFSSESQIYTYAAQFSTLLQSVGDILHCHFHYVK